jgi:ubiquitin-like-conjugating enzyme ATG3
VRAAAYTEVNETTVDEDGWVSALRADDRGKSEKNKDSTTAAGDDDEIVDIDLGELEDEDGGDAATYSYGLTEAASRTYNLYIAYSTSYRVPKLYLSGFNAEGSPLTPSQMFEDIMSDYRDKTVTIERAPFEVDLTVVSIHPCRHAQVMKILIDRADRAEQRLSSQSRENDGHDGEELVKGIARVGLADGEGDGVNDESDGDDWEDINKSETEHAVRVDQYLVLFLKFVASVTPGIEHDFTMSA